ncbi:calmodulin-regulated spectrin-associated protein 1-B-like [Antennarius striatus]|uniref:calmodulin-regulated spectrin-associated protein 1-B-like n=1 Tax=Antennarius striatus TaxID=241820 RepID=UPI0035B1F686
MDVGAGPDGAGTRRTADGGGRGLEAWLVQPELYDPARAKIEANLRWLFATAYGTDGVPADLRDPFYLDQYKQEHIKPPITRLLLSGEPYCRACGPLLDAELTLPPQTHQAVLQTLSRRGVHILQAHGAPVSHLDLRAAPIRMSAHIPLMDALMAAHALEMVSVEQLMSSVRRFSPCSAPQEPPAGLEEALMLWINEVNMKVKEVTEKQQRLLESPGHQQSPSKWYWKLVPVRHRGGHLSGHTPLHFPRVDHLLEDVCNATALLVLVHFYCPELIRLEDVCLKQLPSVADSLSNIQLLQDFCDEFLNRSFHLQPEDLLYSPPVLKNNVLVFIAELFWCFEGVRPAFVQPRALKDVRDVRLLLQPKASRPRPPVSNGTKSRLLTSSNSTDVLKTPPSPDLSAPLRQVASQPVPYALHGPPASESDLSRSISRDSLAPNAMMWAVGSGPQGPRRRPSHLHIQDEEEEPGAVIHLPFARRGGGDVEQDELEIQSPPPVVAPGPADGFYLEPLMPAVPKTPKEKTISLSKQEESGEGRRGVGGGARTLSIGRRKSLVADAHASTVTPTPEIQSGFGSLRPPTEGWKPPQGFFLHLSREPTCQDALPPAPDAGQNSDSDIADLEEDEEGGGLPPVEKRGWEFGEGEGESAKLRDDCKVSERHDKEDGGCSSPALSPAPSSASWPSSGSGVRMTSFAERKLLKLGLRDGFSSSSSSQKTTPDSDGAPVWPLGKTAAAGPPAAPSEQLQLHLLLEEQRRAIEHQKKKMETLSARQRLRLGRAAFLNVVKKGGGRSDTLPLPPKHSASTDLANSGRVKTPPCKDDSCLDVLKGQVRAGPPEGGAARRETGASLREGRGPHSIDLLSAALSSIQQQMTQLTLQQDLLMRQVAPPPATQAPPPATQAPPPATQPTHATQTMPSKTQPTAPTADSKSFAVHFVDIGGRSATPARRPPKLSSAHRSRAKQGDGETLSRVLGPPSPREPSGEGGEWRDTQQEVLAVPQDPQVVCGAAVPPSGEEENNDVTQQEVTGGSEGTRVKGQLIEVDLSELRDPLGDGVQEEAGGSEQSSVLGFFFRDDERAADETARRRAAFLLRQQRKAEETRLRRQQQGAESELKRDEARRKAEEERVRKEEEKARRELIKQEYLRRKQEALREEQGQVRPRPRATPRRNRLKPKGPTTPDLSISHRGSTVSLATEADSIISDGAGSQRAGSVCSMDSFPVLSRTPSRNTERDWDSGSIASSIASVEYCGPKLFREPSTKSNKPIIINAIAHCCLAGKVNESQKNAVLEELDRCDAHHLVILFRDGGCQFRAVYSFSPETEDLVKFTGAGPRTIGHRMVDKLYKYNSDRKQFTIIPARSVSVSVDALTIHSQLWHSRRPGSARRK